MSDIKRRAIRSLTFTGSFASHFSSARGHAEHGLGLEHLPAPDRDRRLQPVRWRRRPRGRSPSCPRRPSSTRVPSMSSIERYAPEWIWLAGELARVVRDALVPQVPVAHEHAGVLGAFRRPRWLDVPAVAAAGADRRDALDPHAEADVGAHAGGVGEALEVARASGRGSGRPGSPTASGSRRSPTGPAR